MRRGVAETVSKNVFPCAIKGQKPSIFRGKMHMSTDATGLAIFPKLLCCLGLLRFHISLRSPFFFLQFHFKLVPGVVRFGVTLHRLRRPNANGLNKPKGQWWLAKIHLGTDQDDV
eukprot:EG_transcript_28041